MKTKLKLLVIIGCFAFTLSCLASHKLSNQDSESIDILIKTDDVTIGGTLMLPTRLQAISLVIMSSGSGPQDRDETLEGFKIFKDIANHLASKGIASFRYDDRGVGESTGDFVNSTIEDHSSDLENIINYFKSSEQHSFNSFILLGHSQGGILAGKVAVGNKSVKKVILMGAPAVPLIEVVTYQIRQDYKNTNLSKYYIEADVSAHNKLMRAIKDDKLIDEAYHQFKSTTEAILFEKASVEKAIDTFKLKQQAVAKADEFRIIYALPSLTSFLYYDPSKDFEQLNVPVLSLFGGLDFQVPIHQNKDRMENALLKSGTKYDFKIFDNANHYFQKAVTCAQNEYSTLKKKFIHDFLNQISEWILQSK